VIDWLAECSAQRHGCENEKKHIKACDKEGNTALHLAVQNGSTEVQLVDKLMRRESAPSLRDAPATCYWLRVGYTCAYI